jgi:hypothetical protein
MLSLYQVSTSHLDILQMDRPLFTTQPSTNGNIRLSPGELPDLQVSMELPELPDLPVSMDLPDL